MSVRLQNNVAYGLTDALLNVPLLPIVANRAPTTNDKAPIGTIWVFKAQNLAYVITSIVNDEATWVIISQGSADFTTYTLQTSDATPTAIIVFSPAPSSGSSFLINFAVMQDDFSHGGGGILQGTIRRGSAGAPVVVGFIELVFNDDTAGGVLDANLVVVGNTVELQVTGINATVFNWKASLTIDELS